MRDVVGPFRFYERNRTPTEAATDHAGTECASGACGLNRDVQFRAADLVVVPQRGVPRVQNRPDVGQPPLLEKSLHFTNTCNLRDHVAHPTAHHLSGCCCGRRGGEIDRLPHFGCAPLQRVLEVRDRHLAECLHTEQFGRLLTCGTPLPILPVDQLMRCVAMGIHSPVSGSRRICGPAEPASKRAPRGRGSSKRRVFAPET